jgi:hypothetical protein
VTLEQLTQMELLQIHELLGSEELAVKKCMAYAEMVKDDELQPYIEQSIQLHQQNIMDLWQLVRDHNGKQGVQQ